MEDDLEQRKEKVAQLLMQKVPPPPPGRAPSRPVPRPPVQPCLVPDRRLARRRRWCTRSTCSTLTRAGGGGTGTWWCEPITAWSVTTAWRSAAPPQQQVRAAGAARVLTFCPLWCPQTFVKGVPPRQKLLPTGGAVLTSEDAYMAMVDRCFPDDAGERSRTVTSLPLCVM